MMAALQSLGVGMDRVANAIVVTPQPLRGPAAIDCGLAGTVMRFVPAIAGLAAGRVHFDGDARARQRPLGVMLAALRTLGVAIGQEAVSLPFDCVGAGAVRGGVVRLDSSGSSQFVSGLLLAGARYDSGVDVRHCGDPIPSMPHIAMTVAMLRERGVAVDDSAPNRWVVAPGPIAAVDVDVEPDLSSAAPFLAAALVTGGTVTIPGWPGQTTQAGDRLRSILTEFGAQVTHSGDALTVAGTGRFDGIDVDLHETGELTPVIAAVAALADSPSHLGGIAHLRGHETDRLTALRIELTALGGDVRETDDGLEIRPRQLTGQLFHTHGDHRLAHAAVVLGLAVPHVYVDDIATAGKTYADFDAAWTELLR